ncbi:MAG: MoaD/ThiS family protein [Acidimicrobiia bacterium]
MAVTVRIPTQLRQLSDGANEAAVEPGTVGELVKQLEDRHPGFAERLLDEQGKLRRFVNVFVGDEDVRFLDGLDTPVPDGETVSIVPAVAGG